MSDSLLSRREALAALASAAALPLVAGCARDGAPSAPPASTDADALTLLDSVADNLLRLQPETSTSLGLDTGARAALRSQLADRSADGQRRLAAQVRADLERVNAIKTDGLTHAVRTSVEVVRSAYATALEGLALPYGDITVGGWRNTPYVVIQNVGAYLDVPRFLDSDHRIENSADAEAYLARLQSCARQLDGELGRIQAARAAGLVPPAFLIDKALGQMRLAAKNESPAPLAPHALAPEPFGDEIADHRGHDGHHRQAEQHDRRSLADKPVGPLAERRMMLDQRREGAQIARRISEEGAGESETAAQTVQGWQTVSPRVIGLQRSGSARQTYHSLYKGA